MNKRQPFSTTAGRGGVSVQSKQAQNLQHAKVYCKVPVTWKSTEHLHSRLFWNSDPEFCVAVEFLKLPFSFSAPESFPHPSHIPRDSTEAGQPGYRVEWCLPAFLSVKLAELYVWLPGVRQEHIEQPFCITATSEHDHDRVPRPARSQLCCVAIA